MNSDEIEEALKSADNIGRAGRWKEAFASYQRLASAGNPHAMVRLGWAYHTGSGVELNPEQAEYWYRKAATSANLWARYQASLFLAKKGHYEESFSMVDKLAHEGYLPAIYRLSKLLGAGRGTDKQTDLSIYYLEYAASHGHIWALRDQAVMMMKGRMGPRKIIPGVVRFIGALRRGFQLGARDTPDVRLMR